MNTQDQRRRSRPLHPLVRWRFSHVPKCPTEGKAAFSSGKPHFRIFSGFGLAFRPTLGILRA